jgi:hypothetical protein
VPDFIGLDDLTWLLNEGYVIAQRDPVLLGVISRNMELFARKHNVAYMVYDPKVRNGEDTVLLGDSIPELLSEARNFVSGAIPH